jgi:hypothetical protein
VPHFQLVTKEGEALGPVELNGPDRKAGQVIYTGTGQPNLRIVNRVESDDPETYRILVVEETG